MCSPIKYIDHENYIKIKMKDTCMDEEDLQAVKINLQVQHLQYNIIQ